MGERLKGVVVSELEGASGKKAWVSLGVMRRAKGGKFSHVDGMIRLSKEKGLKPKKVAVDRPVTVYVSKASRMDRKMRSPPPVQLGTIFHLFGSARAQQRLEFFEKSSTQRCSEAVVGSGCG